MTFSRRAVRGLERHGGPVWCLPDAMARLPLADADAEAARIVATYDIPTLRDVWKTDWACDGRPDAENVERTVRHFIALERIFDEYRPDVVVPEVGSETMRTAAHQIALDRGATVLFLFYTIFPEPLRLYRNSMHAPIVPPDELRELEPAERAEVERFIADFTSAQRPIRDYRAATVTPSKLRDFGRHIAMRATVDADNEYLVPAPLSHERRSASERARPRRGRSTNRPASVRSSTSRCTWSTTTRSSG